MSPVATYEKPTDYAGLASQAQRETGVPAHVLLGLIEVESGGDRWAVSSAGARWSTQFIPGTAAAYGVTGDSVRSQVFGAARYLRDLGYAQNPTKALASYNAGPNNWQVGLGYARDVLGRSKRYSGVGATDGKPNASTPHRPAPDQDEGQGLLERWGEGALHGLLWVALVGAGATMAGIGLSRAGGLRKKAPA